MKFLLSLFLLAWSPVFAADAPRPGDKAPDFALPSEDAKPVALKDYRGKWVVLYFYPKDFTGGCTIEAHGFEKNLKKFAAAGAVVLGVSADTSGSHKEFCAKEGLNFKLLSDEKTAVSAMYGSLMTDRPLSSRNTFLIGPDGKLAARWLKVNPEGHAEEVLAALTERRNRKAAKKP